MKLWWHAFSRLNYIFKSKMSNNIKKYVHLVMKMTARSANRLKVNQRAMKRLIMGICFRDYIRDEDIRQHTKVLDIIEKISNA